jgi:hypothetical protein
MDLIQNKASAAAARQCGSFSFRIGLAWERMVDRGMDSLAQQAMRPMSCRVVQPWGPDKGRQATFLSEHATDSEAFAALDALSAQMVRTGAPSDQQERRDLNPQLLYRFRGKESGQRWHRSPGRQCPRSTRGSHLIQALIPVGLEAFHVTQGAGLRTLSQDHPWGTAITSRSQ